jgi:hypothetical protein
MPPKRSIRDFFNSAEGCPPPKKRIVEGGVSTGQPQAVPETRLALQPLNLLQPNSSSRNPGDDVGALVMDNAGRDIVGTVVKMPWETYAEEHSLMVTSPIRELEKLAFTAEGEIDWKIAGTGFRDAYRRRYLG